MYNYTVNVMCEHIPTNKIINDISPVREKTADKDLVYLRLSIHKYGVLCPIIVRKIEGGYQLVAGGRRLASCKSLGHRTIPAIVMGISWDNAVEIALQENIQRIPCNSIEEAEAISDILKNKNISANDLSKTLCLSENEIILSNKLNSLPGVVKQAALDGKITEQQASLLTRLYNEDIQIHTLNLLISHNYTEEATVDLITELMKKNEL